MNVIYVNQELTPDKRLRTFVEGEIIKVELEVDGVLMTDEFDFSDLEDGIAYNYQFETELPLCPILKAEKTDGVLTVEVIADFWKESEMHSVEIFMDGDINGEDHMENQDGN